MTHLAVRQQGWGRIQGGPKWAVRLTKCIAPGPSRVILSIPSHVNFELSYMAQYLPQLSTLLIILVLVDFNVRK